MYLLFHKLFGWHYASYMFGGSTEIGRIKQHPSGLFVINICCNGWQPLDEYSTTGRRKIFPITLTFSELKDMIKHNNELRSQYAGSP